MIGWQKKRFCDVLTILNGRNQKAVKSDDGKYPILGSAGNVMGYATDYICDEGTTIIGRKGNISTPTYIATKFWNVDTAFGLSPKSGLDKKYLYYYCLSFDFASMNRGTTIPSLVKSELLTISIPFPPLPEQKRIVTILDEAFAGIDQAIANTERNLANARELFDSYLNEVFTRKGEGWEEKSLNSVCVVERGSSPRPIKSYLTEDDSGVNWIKIGDTKGIEKYIETTKQKITQEGALRSRKVESGDFILTNSMSYGKPFIMATTGYIHDGWFVLRLKDILDTEFFFYLLSSNVVQQQFSDLAAGAIVKNISGDLIKKAILPIPSKSQQIALQKRFSLMFDQTKTLELTFRYKQQSLAELKQSLLQKAFTGELTADWREQQA